MKIKDLSYQQVLEASESSGTIKEFLVKLGFTPNNGQYRRARAISEAFNVPLPVFDYKTASKQATAKTRLPDEVYFSKGVHRAGQELKKRLLRDHGFVDKCDIDGCPSPLPEWNGLPIVLQLDHIDGDHLNNEISNLRIVCPNCHTQTETYSNKASKSAAPKSKYYCECGAEIWKTSIRCQSCESSSRKGKAIIDWPPVEEILEQVKLTNYSAYGRVLNVSDNAIRKHLRSNGIEV